MSADAFLVVAALTVLVAAPIALLAGLAPRLIHQFTTARSSSGGRDAQRDPPGGATHPPEEDDR